MLYSPIYIASLYALVAFWSVRGFASPAPKTPLSGTYRPSLTVSSNPSYNASRFRSFAGTAPTGLYSQSNTNLSSSPRLSEYAYESTRRHDPEVCLVGRCSGIPATKTVDEALLGVNGPLTMLSDADLQAACVLWNDTCSGDKTAARNYFFGTLKESLYANACFTKPKDDCTKIESPARMSEFLAIQDWMRSPQCFSGHASYNSMVGMMQPIQDTENCCGICGLTAGIVDVFYWPVLNANTSCLDIIGSEIHPLTYGATIGSPSDGYIGWTDKNGLPTSSLPTYWGCTTMTGDQLSFMSTAVITHVDSVTFKQYMVNPWSAPSCVGSSSPYPRSGEALAPRASIRARAHTLVVRNATSQGGGLPASTTVLNGFTFTSPSIYANFQSVSGLDECGSQTISSTMLSFTPGELSTIEGGFNCPTCTSQITKPFDIRDLPCPPRSVMEANWYMPEPGEPYRPLIAMPDQIRKVNAFFGRCSNAFFTGFDPPKTLLPANAMVPIITAADPNAATSIAPMPSATQDPGASKTAGDERTKPAAGATLAAQDPKETANSVLDPQQNEPAIVSQSKDPRPSEGSPALPGLNPHDTTSNPKVDSGVDGSPGQASRPMESSDILQHDSGSIGDSKQTINPTATSDVNGFPYHKNGLKKPGDAPQIYDPSNVSPSQMSQIENALAPGAQGSQAAPESVQGNDHGSNQQASPSKAVPISPDILQSGNAQALPNNKSPQQDSALPSIDISNPIPIPPATTMSISDHVTAIHASGIHFDGSQVASDQAHVIISSVMAMDPGAGIVLSSYVLNMPSPMQTSKADIQQPHKSEPTIIAGESAQRIPNGISIAGATLTPGTPRITIQGTPVAVGSSGLIIGTSTIPLPTVLAEQVLPPSAGSHGPTTIMGQAAQSVSNGISIAGVTLAPGAPPVTISGTPVFVGSSGLVIGSSTVLLAAVFPKQITSDAPSYQPTTINGERAQFLSNGGISIAGTTLTAGASAITISGTPISVGWSNFIIGSSTVPLAAAFKPVYQPTTINGQEAQLLPNGVSIAGTTLTPGAPAITISGTPISIGPSGLAVGTESPIPLPNAFPKILFTTLANQAITILPTAAEFAGATLTPGSPALTISGIPISVASLGPNSISLVAIPPGTTIKNQLITTLANQALTAAPTAVEVAGSHLAPGAPGITVGGTLVSLNTAGDLILGSQTIALQSESGGLGGLIMVPFPTSTAPIPMPTGTGNGGKPVAGRADTLRCSSWLGGMSALVVVVFIVVQFL